MTNVSDIYSFIDSFAPFATAMSIDNCGILVGDKNRNISKAVICLDITNAVIDEAKSFDAQLIISHHPVIFSPLSSVCKDSIVYQLIENRLSAICAHTNLDVAQCGVSSNLAEKIGLKNICGMDISDETRAPQWFSGELKKALDPESFAKIIKEELKAGCVKYSRFCREIKKVGVCGGSGADYIENALKSGMDAFVTSEVKHHQMINAKDSDMCIIDAGHFSTEAHIAQYLEEMLKKRFPGVMFKASNLEEDPALYV